MCVRAKRALSLSFFLGNKLSTTTTTTTTTTPTTIQATEAGNNEKVLQNYTLVISSFVFSLFVLRARELWLCLCVDRADVDVFVVSSDIALFGS